MLIINFHDSVHSSVSIVIWHQTHKIEFSESIYWRRAVRLPCSTQQSTYLSTSGVDHCLPPASILSTNQACEISYQSMLKLSRIASCSFIGNYCGKSLVSAEDVGFVFTRLSNAFFSRGQPVHVCTRTALLSHMAKKYFIRKSVLTSGLPPSAAFTPVEMHP